MCYIYFWRVLYDIHDAPRVYLSERLFIIGNVSVFNEVQTYLSFERSAANGRLPMPTRTRRRLREHTVGLLARKWTLKIAAALSSETMRHSEIARCLPGITQKVLTETLREMERTGIVEREVYPIVPPKVEYRLTSVGIELLKLSQEFASWFDTHHENIHKAKRNYDRQSWQYEIISTSIFLTEMSKSRQNLFWRPGV